MRNRKLLLLIPTAAFVALALAACGGGDDNSNSTAASSTPATSTAPSTAAIKTAAGSTVAVQSIDGNDVLVDGKGQALYTNNMDTASKIACTGECASIWVPLAAPSGGQPTSDDSSVNGKLGTVDRSDGTTQVTFDGMPLYTFVQDSPGQATGDGVSDSFGGTDFVWTVTSTGGASTTAGASTSTSSSSGGSYGGGSSGGGYGGY